MMNYQDLKDKLRRHYFDLQIQKLYTDTYYTQLQDRMKRIVAHSIPKLKIVNGVVEQGVSEGIEMIRQMVDEYIYYNYPILHKEKTKLKHDIFEYTYIDLPEQLSLKQIDTRLTLFKDYLKYRIDCLFNQSIWGKKEPLEYDEWLYMKGYEQLIEVIWN